MSQRSIFERGRALGGKPDAGGPVAGDEVDDLVEVVLARGLGDVGGDAEHVGLLDVVLAVRGREDDDRQMAKAHVRAQHRQRREAVHARHVEVEQRQGRARQLDQLVAGTQVIEELRSVAEELEIAEQLLLAKRVRQQRAIVRIVLHDPQTGRRGMATQCAHGQEEKKTRKKKNGTNYGLMENYYYFLLKISCSLSFHHFRPV